jgi:Sec-independent protein translocase protein TatA
MMFGEIFGPDLLIVAIVLVVLLFGGAAIPKFAKSLGSAKSEFENGMAMTKTSKSDIEHAITQVTTTDPTT